MIIQLCGLGMRLSLELTCSTVNNCVAITALGHRDRHNGTITQGQLVPCAVNTPNVVLSSVGGVSVFSGSHDKL